MPEAGGGSRGRPSASGSLTCNALSRHTDLTRAVNTPEAERTNKRRAYLKAKPPCRDRGRGARGLITASEATHWPGRPPPAPRAPGLARWGAGAGAPAAAAARGQAARLAGARAAGRGRRGGAGGPRLGSHFSASPAAALPRPPPRRAGPPGVTRGIRAGGEPGAGSAARGEGRRSSFPPTVWDSERRPTPTGGGGAVRRAAPGKVQLVTED